MTMSHGLIQVFPWTQWEEDGDLRVVPGFLTAFTTKAVAAGFLCDLQ